jgi:hypothetical protein
VSGVRPSGGCPDWGTDEIYAGIRIVDRATGKVLEGIETFRVTGNF